MATIKQLITDRSLACNLCSDIEMQCHIAGSEEQLGSSVQLMKSVLKFCS